MTQQPDEGHRGGCLITAGAFQEFSETGQQRNSQRFGLGLAPGQESAQRHATFQQVFRLGALGRRAVKRRIHDFLVADGNIESRPELAQLLFVQLFLLVGNIAAFARFAQAVTLHGLGQNHRRLVPVLGRGLVRGVNLARVVAAAQQFANLVVAQVIHQRE